MKNILFKKKRNKGILIVSSLLCIFLITTSTTAIIETSFKTSFISNSETVSNSFSISKISNDETEALSYTFSFTEPSLKEMELHDSIYAKINMPGAMTIGKKAGEPAIPVKFVKLLLEPKKTVSNIKVFGVPVEIDTGNINLKDKPVLPYQYPVPIGTKTPNLFVFDNDLYTSADSYPSSIVEEQTIGYCRGYTILNIAIHPVQYIPGKGSLLYYPEITVTIELEGGGYVNPFYRNDPDDEEWVKKLVYNPETTEYYQSGLPILDYPGGICDPSDDYDYVIITTTQNGLNHWSTSSTIPYNWTSLMDKHAMDDGLSCTLVTIQDIDACSDYYNSDPLFNDSQAHIREFCKDAYQDWGTDYIFIGGDAEWIPARLMDYDYESNVDADIYWNHLDNTFNEDHDNDWGEEGDTGFDLYAEMYIGRITCDTPQDVSNWMKKSFYYADSTFKDYLDNAAFYGGNTGWSCEGDDFIDYSAIKGTNNWLGPSPGAHGSYPAWLGFQYGFETWNALTPGMNYNLSIKWTAEPPNPGWSGGSESAAVNGLKAAINNDQVTLISGIAHANEHMSLDVYDSTWESSYHNTMPFFIHDYGCHCGDMDATDDGVLHSMLFHSDTELAFGCVYNTGYGWGSLEDTNSSSALQQKLFWDYIFDTANNSGSTMDWQLGKAMAFSKDSMAPTIDWTYSGAPGSWRGIIQSCLLFGDPAQRIKPPVQPEHNVGIQEFDVSSHEPADTDTWINATLYNNGIHNETNVVVRFLVNDVEENSTTIFFFEKSTIEEVGWLYHTPSYGWETLCINVTLVPGENISEDNVICQDVIYGPDIAVTQIQAPDSLGQGFAKPVKGFIENLGPTDETVTINLIANNTVVNTTSIYLTSGSSTWVTFMWDATTSGLGTYDVIVHAVPVPDEYYLNNQNKSHTVTVFFVVGNVLLVDDDEGDNYETWYENAILASQFIYEIWDRSSQSSPSPSTMQEYDAVVWFTGDDWTTTLESIDQSNLATYLDNGGSLFISGQDIGYDIRSTSFYSDYLHANYLVDTAGWDVNGETGDIIGDGLAFGISSGDGANNQVYPDGISPIVPATSCFYYSDASPYKAGIRVDTVDYRLVYLSFGFEAIDNMADRVTVMNRSLIWLANITSPSNQSPVFLDEDPSDGSINVPVTTTSLTVTIEDPEGDNFDWSIETNPGIGSSGDTGDSNGTKACSVSGLTYATTYTWYVNATDAGSGIWTREIYTFTTESSPNNPPNIPSNPDPYDGETGVDVNADLSWTGGDPDPGDTVTYDVYFGDSSPPPQVAWNQSGTAYDPGTMNPNTQYYWMIVAWDNHGASTVGPEWDFTTENNPPYVPSNPDPYDGETGVDVNADLSWTGGDPDPGDTVTYDVYFGTSSSPPKVSSNQSSTTYDPGTMNYNTQYYWKIVAWDNHGASTSGPIWDFTTGSEPNAPPNPPSDPDPEDGATDVSIDAVLSWNCSDPDGDPLVYDVYLEADDPTPDILVSDDQTGTTYNPEGLEYGTTYYWQIIAKDSHSASTTGPVWEFTTVEAVPDLTCDGTLSWTDISPGGTVTGNFTVENIGDPTSLLDWEIDSHPSWGTWTFTPEDGDDLTPEYGPFTVEVSVVAPDEQNQQFSGQVTIVNKEDSTDNCTISVSLATPFNQPSNNHLLLQFIQKLIQRFPILEQILSSLPVFNKILNF